MCYSATAIANYFIKKAKDTGEPLSNMHLQKIIFFAHAAYFKQTGKPLFSDPVVAWQHGPVIESLYHRLKQYGNGEINDEISVLKSCDAAKVFPCRFFTPSIQPNDKDVVEYLDDVWEKLARVDTWRLRALSHAEGGAWFTTVKKFVNNPADDNEVRDKLPRNLTILDNTIMECGR
jgi:uncharacterized phage-associated protein